MGVDAGLLGADGRGHQEADASGEQGVVSLVRARSQVFASKRESAGREF